MKSRFLYAAPAVALLAVALLAVPLSADEMTLDEVLANHFEALGGLEKIKSVEAMELKGTMTLGPGAGDAPFTMILQRPGMLRMEFVFQGMTAIQAYDGEQGWAILPFLGKTEPEVLNEDQVKQLREQSEIDGPLVDWQDKGHKVELVGLEETQGTEAYKIKVELAAGDVRYHFLDSEAFVTIQQEGTTLMQGQEIEFETTLSEYKEVDGLMIPHSITSKPKGAPEGQTITISGVTVNPEVSADAFKMPVKEEAPEGEAEGKDES